MADHSTLTGGSLHGSKIATGAGAPVSTPTYVGQTYYDTTNNNLYVAEGTSSSADWIPTSIQHVGSHTFSGTTTANTAVTFPTTGTLATLAGAEALTNKTISGASNTISNINLASQVTGTLPIANGGTGQTSQTAAFDGLAPTTTKGDLIAHDGSDNIRVAVGTNGQVLTADSAQTSGLSWTSPLTNPMTTLGDSIYGGAAGAATRLAGNITTSRKLLTQLGDGVNSAAPAWNQIDNVGYFASGAEYVPGTSRGVVNSNGVLGFTDGSAGTSGYVGETIKTSTSGTPVDAGGSDVYTDVLTIVLTAGSWSVSVNWQLIRNGATWSASAIFGLSTTSGNSFPSQVLSDNAMFYNLDALTTATVLPANLSDFQVNVSSTTTYYFKARYTYSGGPPQTHATALAVRRR